MGLDIDYRASAGGAVSTVALDKPFPVQIRDASGNAVTSWPVDTELPAAAALADNTANPTTPLVGACLEAWDGSNWQRIRNLFADSDGRGAVNALCVNGLNYVVNGSNNWDRARSAVAADGTTGTGLPGVALLAHDGGSTFNRITSANSGDGVAPQFVLASCQDAWNGASLDRWRNNVEGTVLSSAVRAASTNSSDQTNHNVRGVVVTLDITNTPNNAETLTLQIQFKDPVTGKYQTVTAYAALTASVLGANPTTATFLYTLYPAALETAAVSNHEVMGLALPRTWRVRVVHSAGSNWTYSVGYQLIQ
jgi:hypothetical protein